MARPAPATERTVALVTFLADHPGSSFSLSELARRLEMNKATAHSMLTALTSAGWLARHPIDKTYRLGPALIALSHATSNVERDLLGVARDEMRRLADDLGVQCVASTVIGDEMVLLAVEGRVPAIGLSAQPGHRVPLAPPLGTVFMAWADPATIDRWLRRLGTDASEERLELYRRALATVRQRGYALGLEADAGVRLGAALAGLGAARSSRRARAAVAKITRQLELDAEYLLLDLDPSASYRLSIIAAPVFGRDGNVAMALTLFGFRGRLTAEQVPAYAARLVGVAEAVSAAGGGWPAGAVAK